MLGLLCLTLLSTCPTLSHQKQKSTPFAMFFASVMVFVILLTTGGKVDLDICS